VEAQPGKPWKSSHCSLSSTEVEWMKSDGEVDKLLNIQLPIACTEYPTVSKLHQLESSASLRILHIPSKTVCKLEEKNYEQEGASHSR
jgi:hypothetical protein